MTNGSTSWDELTWSSWCPLRGAGRDVSIPHLPGLYRIRRVGRSDLDYIGQTGSGTMTLRKRLAMLSGVYADEMPYRDPHTAGPGLWALRHALTCDFEVSVASVTGSTPWRKGLEAVAIAVYRQDHGQSPTIEFGRVPIGYRASSQNNERLVRLALRFRGGPWDEETPNNLPGIPPRGPLTGDPKELTWGGHQWSPWEPLRGSVGFRAPSGTGLYRLRGDDPRQLLYIGQGLVPARPLAHVAKMREADHPQGRILIAQARLEVSWVVNDAWLPHHRLELENDLIAAHVLELGTIPAAQFLG